MKVIHAWSFCKRHLSAKYVQIPSSEDFAGGREMCFQPRKARLIIIIAGWLRLMNRRERVWGKVTLSILFTNLTDTLNGPSLPYTVINSPRRLGWNRWCASCQIQALKAFCPDTDTSVHCMSHLGSSFRAQLASKGYRLLHPAALSDGPSSHFFIKHACLLPSGQVLVSIAALPSFCWF